MRDRTRLLAGIAAALLLGLTGIAASRIVSIATTSRATSDAQLLVLPERTLPGGPALSSALAVTSDESGAGKATKVWSQGSDRIVEVVHRFENPLLAQWYFRRSDPVHNLHYDHPGEISKPQALRGTNADSIHLFCGATGDAPLSSPLSNCATWVYWARYGQYVVELSWGDPRAR